jgi:predicted  nucleic acid-binding Zn-ribbon protein
MRKSTDENMNYSITAEFCEKLDLVVVLGMHRSGTSAVTRGLLALGVDLGQSLLPPMPDVNDKGFWEDAEINKLNEDILAFLGVTWHSLSLITSDQADKLTKSGYLSRAVTLIRNKIKRGSTYGLKDPRIAKLIIFWKRVFNHCRLAVGYVIVIRNPITIAESLTRRDGFDSMKSHLLWIEHTLNSLVYTAQEKRIVIEFENLLNNPVGECEKIADCLNLPKDSNAIELYSNDFLDLSLCHALHHPEDLIIDSLIPRLAIDLFCVARSISSSLLQKEVDLIALNSINLRHKDISEVLEYIDTLTDTIALSKQELICIQANEQKNNDHREEILKLRNIIQQSDEKIKCLLLEIRETSDQLNVSQLDLTRSRKDVSVNNEYITSLREEYQNTKDALSYKIQEINEIKTKLSLCKNEVAESIFQISEKDKLIRNINEELNHAKITLIQKDEKTQKYEITIDHLRGDLKSSNSEKIKFAEDLKEASQSIEIYKKEISEVNHEITKIKEDLDACQANFEFSEIEKTQIKEDFERAKQSIAINQKQVLDTNDAIKKIRIQVVDYQRDIELANLQNIKLKEKIDTANLDIKNYQDELNSSKDKIIELTKFISEQEDKINTLELILESAKNWISSSWMHKFLHNWSIPQYPKIILKGSKDKES